MFDVSITSRCGGGLDPYIKTIMEDKIMEVSITSRCGGGLDCIPASPHGYAANRDFDFSNNPKYSKSATLYTIILALFLIFVKKKFI